MKKSKVVAGKKLTCLSAEILKIGHREAEIRSGKEKVKSGDHLDEPASNK